MNGEDVNIRNISFFIIILPFTLFLSCILVFSAQANESYKFSAGRKHTFALEPDGTLWAWGTNQYYVWGISLYESHTPIQIGSDTDWASITAGGQHTVALKTDGTLWAWGSNSYGQGDGTTVQRRSPIQIGSDTDWASVTAGSYHTIALKTDGTLWAWGSNFYGNLGDGTNTDRHSPVQIGSDTDWASVTAGSIHVVALKADGTLWAWGSNDGQLGDGTITNRNSPIQIGPDTDWASVTAGGEHTIALKTDGTLWAWGRNRFGEIGDGTTAMINSPIQIGTDTDWASVTAGYSHTIALKTDGTLWAWGSNDYGQLGDGTTMERHSPVQIGSSTNWISITASDVHTIALKTDRTLWAWGRNIHGQLGDGTTTDRHYPIRVADAAIFPTIDKGDLNCDGDINLEDAILALQIVSGKNPSGICPDYKSSGVDLNGDDKIGLADALGILRIITTLGPVKINTTDQNGEVVFIDSSSGENVIVKVIDADTNAPIADIDIYYFDGEGYEIFFPIDEKEEYFGLPGVYGHNSIHALTMHETGSLENSNFPYLKTEFQEDGTLIISKYIKNYGINRAGYKFIGQVSKEQAIDDLVFSDRVREFAFIFFEHTISYLLLGPFSHFVIPSPEINNFVTELNNYVNANNIEVFDVVEMSFPDCPKCLPWNLYYKTNVPEINITSFQISVNSVEVSWLGNDASTYDNLIPDLTVQSGPTETSDLTYSYQITKNGQVYNGFNWIAYSENTSVNFSITDSGTYTFELRVKDEVENTGTASQEFIISTIKTWYKDADGDKYSDGTSQTSVNRPNSNYYEASDLTATLGDCDDNVASMNPGAAEVCGDGIDQDCNGSDLSCGATYPNTVIDTISVGNFPGGVVVTPNGNYVYVANAFGDSVSVIQTSNNTVIDTISVGDSPQGVVVTPNGNYVYVVNFHGHSVSVIQTSNNTVIDTISVGEDPLGVAVTPNGNYVYVTNGKDDSVSVIQTSNNTVIDTISEGGGPHGVAVTPNGNYVYVVMNIDDMVSVIGYR